MRSNSMTVQSEWYIVSPFLAAPMGAGKGLKIKYDTRVCGYYTAATGWKSRGQSAPADPVRRHEAIENLLMQCYNWKNPP